MKKYSFILVAGLLLAAVPAMAMSGQVNVSLPAKATEVAPNIFSLGSAIDPASGKRVEGLAIIHPKQAAAKPDHAGGGGAQTKNRCYAVLAKGAAWKMAEAWRVNPTNSRGLDEAFVLNNLMADVAEWESTVGNSNIFGDGSVTATALLADNTAPDGLNEVYFGAIDGEGTIAVTIVWGIFSGSVSQRELVEWDMVFDQTDFDWANDGRATAMDFENIAQHELGHAFGLGHPSDGCTEETMYRFADYGETIKRDLNTGDIAGINQLY